VSVVVVTDTYAIILPKCLDLFRVDSLMLRKTPIVLPQSHKVTKIITLFINGHFKMKHSLKNLCVLVPWWQAF